MIKKQMALIVLDGWGYREDTKDNAIAEAKKPIFDDIWNKYSHTTIEASGLKLGLPDGQIGNSEIGHMTIGAGRILEEDLVRINKAVLNGEIEKSETLHKLFDYVIKNNSNLHVAGLVSPGGIHSHISHLFACLQSAKDYGVTKILIHVFTDGRDTPPNAGAGYIKQLEDFIEKLGVGEIASVSGRLYAMDRDKRWERLAKAEEVIFDGKGSICDTKPSTYLDNLYKNGLMSDESLLPFVCKNKDGGTYGLNENDGFFLFNFRADRMRMISERLIEKRKENNLMVVTMTNYGKEFDFPIVFPQVKVTMTLGKILSENGLTQAHIAETEKFAHATYFLNCGEETPYKGEEQILVQSPKGVLTYDLAPKMAASGVADKAIEQIQKGTDFIFINFANADMVGHTANVPAIETAVEEVDRELGRVLEAINKNGGIAIVTADHGNAELNIDQTTGDRHTSHTTDPVPFIITNITSILHKGTLADITPTILKILDIKKPEEMTGESLID
ncbi:MAG: 2,3-bisphosphoglycerate-independent phosphoglycerate mutase [Candidatus Nomurabacteria bacterium]|nr:2,3-bisphosphoglycerate-independent phosphoglycerate mutase [Candidatus Nomurabacteria bacterium]